MIAYLVLVPVELCLDVPHLPVHLLLVRLHHAHPLLKLSLLALSEVGIYKKNLESKKTRKQELEQESDQENKKKLSFFLDHFLGRVLVFFLFFLFSCFLTFLFSFINFHLCTQI